MDPALCELYESGSSDDEVSVILRLSQDAKVPDGARVVSRFGESIVTARIRRGDIRRVWESDEVVSVKAPRALSWPAPIEEPDTPDPHPGSAEVQEPGDAGRPLVAEDGSGVVVGICDWGFDFTHANFRNADGSTRLMALWDQAAEGGPPAPHFGYGRLHTREAINAALEATDPFEALGYHPSRSDPGSGCHGTHVADILAGNRREPGSQVGLASGAEIVFVHLGADNLGARANFGDSVRLLEGIDFVVRQAGDRPCVVHLSAGKTGGAHRGETPFERAVDAMLAGRANLSLTQSCGNYADAAMHAHARIGPDQRYVLVWFVSAQDRTPNELEVWYSGEDVFDVTLVAPNGAEFSAPLDGRARLDHAGASYGNLYHRRNEPNSGLNHIDIFLSTAAPAGRWRVALRGRAVVDGRFHAWIERDARGHHQSRFLRSQATSLYTTNTICNSFRAIAVGAYDATRPDRPATRFSSRGPTADGRQKPELVAPGYRIRAARSAPAGGWSVEPRLTVKSGTSMAAPWVSGTVALMFQAAGRPLTINEVRSLLIGTADPHPGPPGRSSTRLGYGYLNPAAAVAAARRVVAEPKAAAVDAPRREDAAEEESVAMAPPGAIDPGPMEFSSEARTGEAATLDAEDRLEEGYAPDADGEVDDDPGERISLEEVHEALLAEFEQAGRDVG
jgi:subtilisin family serine protease